MYKFNDKNEEEISLHDCRATSAELNGDKLVFRFTDGFWNQVLEDRCWD